MSRRAPRSRSATVPSLAPSRTRKAAQFKKAESKVEKYHDERARSIASPPPRLPSPDPPTRLSVPPGQAVSPAGRPRLSRHE
jgi:hypothetical protein